MTAREERWTEAERAEASALWAKGLPTKDIAARFGAAHLHFYNTMIEGDHERFPPRGRAATVARAPARAKVRPAIDAGLISPPVGEMPGRAEGGAKERDGGQTLAELEPRACRFPVAGCGATMLFCAVEIAPEDYQPGKSGGSYCPEHRKLANQPRKQEAA